MDEPVATAGVCVRPVEYLFEEAREMRAAIEASLAERTEPLSFAEVTHYILNLGVTVPGRLMPRAERGAIKFYRDL